MTIESLTKQELQHYWERLFAPENNQTLEQKLLTTNLAFWLAPKLNRHN